MTTRNSFEAAKTSISTGYVRLVFWREDIGIDISLTLRAMSIQLIKHHWCQRSTASVSIRRHPSPEYGVYMPNWLQCQLHEMLTKRSKRKWTTSIPPSLTLTAINLLMKSTLEPQNLSHLDTEQFHNTFQKDFQSSQSVPNEINHLLLVTVNPFVSPYSQSFFELYSEIFYAILLRINIFTDRKGR